MARKTLLTESELRRFMKLAELRPVADERIQEMGSYHTPGLRDEEEDEGLENPGDLNLEEADEESELHATEDELGHEDHVADEEGAELDMADDELAADDAMMDEPAADPGVDAALEAKFAEFMQQVASVAQEVLGIDVDVEGGPEDAGMDAGMDDVEMGVVADDPMGGEEELAMADVEVSPEGGEEEEEAVVMDDEEMVAEVAKRVAARLQRENKQAQMVDELAERIMNRLTK